MVYLIHALFIYWFLGNLESSYNFTHTRSIMFLLSLICVSTIAAIPSTLIFEAPFMNLEKAYLMPKKKERTSESLRSSELKYERAETLEESTLSESTSAEVGTKQY